MNKATIQKLLAATENRIEVCEKGIKWEEAKIAWAEANGVELFYNVKQKIADYRHEISELSVKRALYQGQLKTLDR